MISIILPAHNEASYIETCLGALFASRGIKGPVEVIVVANACTDATAELARALVPAAIGLGWELQVVDVALGGKLNALNVGDAVASGDMRVYLDADVLVSPTLLAGLASALDKPQASYASGDPRLSKTRNKVTHAYGRFWRRLPFVTDGVPGFGIFAVNAAGRARWGAFPDIIADDIFVRLQFDPKERTRVAAQYHWPMVEGFANLVRVRRRQNAGVDEISRDFPQLSRNDDKTPVTGLIGRFLADPVGFVVYVAVALAVKTPLFSSKSNWARGR